METLLLLLTTAFGSRTPLHGNVVELSDRQQLDLLYLVRAGREIDAIRQVRTWKNASLRDAVKTVWQFRSLGMDQG